MPPAPDEAAVVRPNPDSFHSSYAFTLRGPDELDDMPPECPTIRCYGGAPMRALNDIIRWAIPKQRRVAGRDRRARRKFWEKVNRWLVASRVRSDGGQREETSLLPEFGGLGNCAPRNVLDDTL
jgi:hypothetical protein